MGKHKLRRIDANKYKDQWWKPEPGEVYHLDIVGVEEAESDFNGTRDEPVPIIKYYIGKIDNLTYDEPAEWGTSSNNAHQALLPIINKQVKRGRKRVRVLLTCHSKKRYSALDHTTELLEDDE